MEIVRAWFFDRFIMILGTEITSVNLIKAYSLTEVS